MTFDWTHLLAAFGVGAVLAAGIFLVWYYRNHE